MNTIVCTLQSFKCIIWTRDIFLLLRCHFTLAGDEDDNDNETTKMKQKKKETHHQADKSFSLTYFVLARLESYSKNLKGKPFSCPGFSWLFF